MLFQFPLLFDLTRSGWHLPFNGVAVVSPVLCTSATLNKRKKILSCTGSAACSAVTLPHFRRSVKRRIRPLRHIVQSVPKPLPAPAEMRTARQQTDMKALHGSTGRPAFCILPVLAVIRPAQMFRPLSLPPLMNRSEDQDDNGDNVRQHLHQLRIDRNAEQ